MAGHGWLLGAAVLLNGTMAVQLWRDRARWRAAGHWDGLGWRRVMWNVLLLSSVAACSFGLGLGAMLLTGRVQP